MLSIKNNNAVSYLLAIVIVLLLTGCRTYKNETRGKISGISMSRLQQMQAFTSAPSSLSAKLNISADLGGNSFSVGGTLGVEQDAGIQIGITAIGIFEVARVQMTPTDAIFINKVGKEYAQFNCFDAEPLSSAGITYDILQSFFLNEPFIFGGGNFASALETMTVSVSGDEVVITPPEQELMQYKFYFDYNTGALLRTEGIYNTGVHVMCKYSDFTQIDGKDFPKKIYITVEGVGKTLSLDLRLSNIKTGNFTFNKSNTDSYDEKDILRIIDSLK